MNTKLVICAVSILVSFSASAQDAFDVTGACKKECPKSKTNAEAHECAEKKARLNKAFKSSQCWEVNEKYEAAVAKEKAAPETTH